MTCQLRHYLQPRTVSVPSIGSLGRSLILNTGVGMSKLTILEMMDSLSPDARGALYAAKRRQKPDNVVFREMIREYWEADQQINVEDKPKPELKSNEVRSASSIINEDDHQFSNDEVDAIPHIDDIPPGILKEIPNDVE